MIALPIEEQRYTLSRLFLTALVFVAAAPIFWSYVELRQGSIAQAYENAGLYQRVYPTFHYGFTRLRGGDLPLWNPNQACGTPFLADPSTALFQPINALFLALPTEQAMAAHAYVCLALMGFLFVLFARALGAGYLPALFGGATYAFSGAAAAAMSHPALAASLAWTPLVFWAARKQARRARLRGAVITGLAIALLALSGSPPLTVAVLFTWMAYQIYLTLFLGPDGLQGLPRRSTGILVALCVALVVSAIQWMPTGVWAISLQNPAAALWRLDLAGLGALNWRESLRQLVAARGESLPYTGYIGIVSLLAVPAALCHRTARRHVAFFLAAAACCLYLSGRAGTPMPFGFPNQAFVIPAVFSLATLVTLGMDRLLVPASDPHTPRIWAPTLLIIALAGVFFYIGAPEVLGRVIAFLVILLPFLVFRTRFLAVLSGLVLVLFLFVDLTLASVNLYRHPFRDAPECYQVYSPAIGAAQEQALGARVLVSAHPLNPALPSDLGMLVPLAVAGGAQIPLTADQALLWARLQSNPEVLPDFTPDGIAPEAVASPLLNVMGVRAILAAPGGPLHAISWTEAGARFREVRTSGDARLVLNEAALPRAHFTTSWVPAGSVDKALDLLADPEFDAAHISVILTGSDGIEALMALVPETVLTLPMTPLADNAAVCTVTDDAPERVVLHVEAPQPGVTILDDNFAPGWHATVDGIAWPILQANAVFRGIATPAGDHQIVLEYRPMAFKIGLVTTLAGLGSLIFFAFALLTRKRGSKA